MADARRIGEWQGRSVFDEHFDDTTDSELLVVGESPIPVRELVRPLDVPSRTAIMPRNELCYTGNIAVRHRRARVGQRCRAPPVVE
jgi:hypothetical protein